MWGAETKAESGGEGAMERYLLNKKIIDFNEIPEELVKNFLEEYELN